MKKVIILSGLFSIFNTISSLKAEIPLFEVFPQLQNKFSPGIRYRRLGDWPTPVTCAKNAAEQLGIKNFYIKRDDLSGIVENGKRLPGCLREREFSWFVEPVLLDGSNEYRPTHIIQMLGFLNAAFELKKQIDEGVLPEPDLIYVPMRIAVGLFFGTRLAELKCTIIPVAQWDVKQWGGAMKPFMSAMEDIFYEFSKFLDRHNMPETLYSFEAKMFPNVKSVFQELSLDGYESLAHCADDSNLLLENTESIVLDKKWVGGTFAVLVADARRGKLQDKNVLFWNVTFKTDDLGSADGNIDSNHHDTKCCVVDGDGDHKYCLYEHDSSDDDEGFCHQ